MARRTGAPAGTARYSSAWKAGARGAKLPAGLAELADDDPNIDLAFDAGQAGTPYAQFLAENGLGGAPSGRDQGAPPDEAPAGGPRSSRPSPRRSSRRSPSVFRPGQGLPKATPSQPLAPLSAGPVPVAHAGAGLLLGMVFYALVLSVLDYGPSGPSLWFKAKFLNQAAPPKGA